VVVTEKGVIPICLGQTGMFVKKFDQVEQLRIAGPFAIFIRPIARLTQNGAMPRSSGLAIRPHVCNDLGRYWSNLEQRSSGSIVEQDVIT
jgi:hypothetical protein